MRRWLFNITALMSLVLCSATVVLWATSYAVMYTEIRQRLHVQGNDIEIGTYVVRACRGNLYFNYDLAHLPFKPQANFSSNAAKALVESEGGYLLMKDSSGADMDDTVRNDLRWSHVPIWVVTAIFIMFPIIWFKSRRRGLATPGMCANCGYNLTGNASGMCPECGYKLAEPPT